MEGGTLTLNGDGSNFNHVVLAGTAEGVVLDVEPKYTAAGDLTDSGEGADLNTALSHPHH